jgi:hypothetical protein
MSIGRTEYLVAELRAASLRARLAQADIEAVGLALKGGLIAPEQALELLSDCDALVYVEPTAPWRDPDGKVHARSTKVPNAHRAERAAGDSPIHGG